MGNFRVFNEKFTLSTKGEIDFKNLTEIVQKVVTKSNIQNGVVHVFAPHATGIIILTENEKRLLGDIEEFLKEKIPKNDQYGHPSNAHSHLRSMILPPDKTLPVIEGQVGFGRWQSLLFVETDVRPRKRTIVIQVMGT